MKQSTTKKLDNYFGKNKWKLISKTKGKISGSEDNNAYIIMKGGTLYRVSETGYDELINDEWKYQDGDKLLIREYILDNHSYKI